MLTVFKLMRARSRGAKLLAEKRYAEADAVFEAALAHSAKSDLLTGYALSAHHSGRYAEAMDRWDRLRQIDDGLPMAWAGVSSNARALDLKDYAVEVITEALERFPQSSSILSEAARVFDETGRHEEAADLWAQLCRDEDFHPDWRVNLALDLVRLGRYDEAKAQIDDGETSYPNNPGFAGARDFLATTLAGRGQVVPSQA